MRSCGNSGRIGRRLVRRIPVRVAPMVVVGVRQMCPLTQQLVGGGDVGDVGGN